MSTPRKPKLGKPHTFRVSIRHFDDIYSGHLQPSLRNVLNHLCRLLSTHDYEFRDRASYRICVTPLDKPMRRIAKRRFP